MGKRLHGDDPSRAGDHPRCIPQAGVIPFVEDPSGALKVLLIRRRHKRKWGIPKGLIEPADTAAQTARIEALEEAGVEGTLSPEPVGEFEYAKWGGICRVAVFLMRVRFESDEYPESQIRQRRWFDLTDALRRPTRKGVRALLEQLPELIEQRSMNRRGA